MSDLPIWPDSARSRELLGARETAPAGNRRRYAPGADFGPSGAVSGKRARAASQMFAGPGGFRPFFLPASDLTKSK
jgi:hypothetical protein